MNVRAHMLVPPHFLVSTAVKKMRWKDEFRKWLPKLPNSGENGTAVHIKTSMLLVEITGMLYMENIKIRFVRV